MQVFLLRHATRNFTMGDVPLNDEGILQAKELAENSQFSRIEKLICSPKNRARMTIEPLAEKYQLDVRIMEELDQMKGHETESQFISRVTKFCERIQAGEFGSPLLICTHSDWLGAAAQVIPTDSLDIKYKMFQCAESVEFKIEDGLWVIQE